MRHSPCQKVARTDVRGYSSRRGRLSAPTFSARRTVRFGIVSLARNPLACPRPSRSWLAPPGQPAFHRPAVYDPILIKHGVIHDGALVRGEEQVNFSVARLLGHRVGTRVGHQVGTSTSRMVRFSPSTTGTDKLRERRKISQSSRVLANSSRQVSSVPACARTPSNPGILP